MRAAQLFLLGQDTIAVAVLRTLGGPRTAWDRLLVRVHDLRVGELFGLLGVAFARVGRTDEARQAFSTSIREDGGDWIATNPEAQAASHRVWTFQ